MQRVTFNDGWSFRAKQSRFLELATGGGAEWAPVALPHDAMLTEERGPSFGGAATGFHPGGTYEYRKELVVGEELRGKRIMLEFEGVYRDAAVYVNGQLAAHRPYGYSEFVADLNAYLRVGELNRIRVECRAGADSRWYSGAGIYRDVWLVVANPVHVALDGVQITTPDIDDEHAVVAVATEVVNESPATRTVDVVTEIIDAAGTVVARDVAAAPVFAGEIATVRQRVLVARPQRWSVDRPYLYTCRTTVRDGNETLDDTTTSFGIRSLAVDAVRGLRINGEPVKLRGACIHHDNGVLGAATFARAEERRVEILKEAGFNAIRSTHNPMSRAMLDACDRVGMLVMDEAFDMWTTPKSDDDYARSFPEWCETDVTAMVRKDFNHPCVVMYSIGNEIPDVGTTAGVIWSRRLADVIRALDGTRFVTNGINALLALGDEAMAVFADMRVDSEAGVNTQMSEAFDRMALAMRHEIVDATLAAAFATLDVAGYNYLESRYDMDHDLHPNRVIVGSETYPASIDTNWKYIESHPHVIGDFTWTGWDYLGEAGIGRVAWSADHADVTSGFHGSFPALTAWCGDIDITGHRRSVSYYREIVFGLRDAPYIAVERPGHVGEKPAFALPWSWSDTVSSWTWPGHEGEPMRVEVYADADEVELLVNGGSIGRKLDIRAKNRFRAEFETTFAPGEIVAVAYRAGAECGRMALRSATGGVLLDVDADRSEIAADGRDLAYVTITLLDADGTPYTSADRKVEIDLDGPGVLQGFGSANPTTEERFADTVRTTFDGRALAVVRPTGPGVINAIVTTDGCEPKSVEINAR